MSFAQPQSLLLLFLLPLALIFRLWSDNRRKEALVRLGDPKLLNRLSEAVNWPGRRWRGRLWTLAFICLIIALARPQWGTQVQLVEQEGVQVMVALDVSKSMLAQDLKPDRLTRAKLEISDLMGRLNGDEIGLVLFSGASFIQFPLTSDYDTARAFLDHAAPDVISRPGTAIGEAIETAMNGFDPRRNSQKVIVIMTDGEDHEAKALAAAEQAAENDALIYTIGFGSSQGEPIPEFDPAGRLTGYKKDENGNVILSKLDEVTLQQVALAANGRYFRATADGSELDQLIDELNGLQAEQLQSRFETRRIERFQWFLLVTFLALLVSEFIPERKRTIADGKRRRLSLATLLSSRNVTFFSFGLLGLLLTACSASPQRLLARGNEAFSRAAYDEALQAYQSAQELAPEMAEPLYNIGNTRYRQEAYPEAQQLFQQAMPMAEDELAQHTAYNLGNSYFKMEQWEAAVEAYKEALRSNPDDADAKYNLELALQHIQEQEQENQEEQQESSENQAQQEQQDEQDQDQQEQDQQDSEQPDEGQEPQEQPDQGEQEQPDGQDDSGEAEQTQAQQVEALTEEQARQLLEAIGGDVETLQERLQQIYAAPGPPPEKDW